LMAITLELFLLVFIWVKAKLELSH
jgi:hypothetical protein